MTYVICSLVVHKILFINRFHTFDKEDGHLDKHRFNEHFFRQGRPKNDKTKKNFKEKPRTGRKPTWWEWLTRWNEPRTTTARGPQSRKENKAIH